KSFALKFMSPQTFHLAEPRARFEREAIASMSLRTKHVVRVVDVKMTEHGLPYIVLELLHGRDLEAELHARRQFSIPVAVRIILQACEAMGQAHEKGIIHRDLKPSNLFLAEDTDGHAIIKVLDFGISKVTDAEAEVTATCATFGTPAYMSPEQVRSSKNV